MQNQEMSYETQTQIIDHRPVYYTRRDAIDLIRTEYGLPVTLSSFQRGPRKLCPDKVTPCSKAPPESDHMYGKRHLYTEKSIRDWAHRLGALGVVS